MIPMPEASTVAIDRACCLFCAVCVLIVVSECALAETEGTWTVAERQEMQWLVDEMASTHGIPKQITTLSLKQAKKQPRILELMDRPAERRLEWKDYQDIFLTPKRIASGQRFKRSWKRELDAIESRYHVSASVIVSILGVETSYGEKIGNFNIIDSLSTLSFSGHRRSTFFKKELAHFLLLTWEHQFKNLSDLKGSYAGAMGMPQFMPSSYRAYAVSHRGYEKADIWQPTDAMASIANYLKSHGWKYGKPVAAVAKVRRTTGKKLASGSSKPNSTLQRLKHAGWTTHKTVPLGTPVAPMVFEGKTGKEYWIGFWNFFVITRYNPNSMYALAVHQLAQAIR
ncbi:Membrane-bound lytic murein transglycosylase B [invertebrate metagenome]|uniref:Membrane-bound lytic murein transglycosylase B n=1 Tax=invertebrate metagenome TaxID=1711999 RepID=A0A2H9TBB3_9ZZZZ